MSVLLHISDTHFGTEQAPVLAALLALAAQQRPSLVVLSGDITQRARPAQFRAARAFVDQLGAPVLAIPGNHDIALFDLWARLRRPYARYAQAFGTELEPVHSTADWLVMGVNTTRPWRHQHGELSAGQVDRVARRLRAASPQQLRVVVVHQPLAVADPREQRHLLRGHAAAGQAWAAAGADVVLGGHIHLPYTLALNGAARPMWVVQAGTGVSSRIRPGVPNSVNILRWGLPPEDRPLATPSDAEPGRVCHIEQWDFAQREHAFVCAGVTTVWPARTAHAA